MKRRCFAFFNSLPLPPNITYPPPARCEGTLPLPPPPPLQLSIMSRAGTRQPCGSRIGEVVEEEVEDEHDDSYYVKEGIPALFFFVQDVVPTSPLKAAAARLYAPKHPRYGINTE